MGKIKITEDMALNAIGKNFDFFEFWHRVFMNPGKKLPWTDGSFITVGSKKDKITSEDAYFQAGITTVMKAYCVENNLTAEFSPEALLSIQQYACYYNAMKNLADKDVGIVLSDKKDEHGLPQFEGIPEKLLETEQELIKIYGEDWREQVLNS